MPDEVRGAPFPDGEEPDDHDHGATDDALAPVVLDEAFVRAAPVHEPSAAERRRAAAQAQARAEAEAREDAYGYPGGDGYDETDGYGDQGGYGGWGAGGFHDDDDGHGRAAYAEWARDRSARHRPPLRWHRPVAWLLAVVMGVGVLAAAFAAVSRGGSGQRDEPRPPPASSERDDSLGGPDTRPPAGAAQPRGVVLGLG
ncbi:hypothetical protein V1J52_09380 [Streptomyces sp. TRM 70351]|uniref:SCO2584 family spore wall biosynthesis protein n=1 Tax=Streptomyces sp. TRM 70351 TaxID=3116552 RepID=UPI002E7BF054|nr:hypothetical protein [Streptomyces sp. TRM 70351]MEE1928402.1 hypothetical protein [Streptomyces sp. TRM 70351]